MNRYDDVKQRLESFKMMYENSVNMYEMTLKQMQDRGVSKESISFVIEMKRETEEQIKEIEEALANLETYGAKKADFIVANSALLDKLATFNPFTRNRFLVDFETDSIKDYFVESASYSKDQLIVRLRNCEGFFVPEYFEKNNYFEVVRIYLLSPYGEKKAMATFYGVKVEDVQMDDFDYKDDGVLGTTVLFSFKKVDHSSDLRKIEKDPR